MIHMEGMKGGGGGGRVVGVGEDHDMGEYGMHQCIDHPHHRNSNPSGGICAFCLQEKLGKLVSSSSPLPIQPSSSSLSSPPSSSSSPPSFRSNTTAAPAATTAPSASSSLSLSVPPKKNNGSDHRYNEYYMRSRLPFLLAKKKKKPSTNSSSSSSSAPATSDIIFKRSKSTATPRRDKFLDDAGDDIVIGDFSPRKRHGFWSFLYLSSKPSSSSSSIKKLDAKSFRDSNGTPRISASTSSGLMSTVKPREKCMAGSTSSSLGRKSDTTVVEESDNASSSSFERKVSRSRSVGCGSRSFSGDFFERISTGFGDCTLRRVESQREGNKPHKVAASAGCAIVNRGGDHHHHHHHHHHQCMKERVRCGGIFGGFMMMTNSSSYWVSSSGGDDGMNGRVRSWGWAFASPMRAFSSNKASSKDNKNEKNATPNLQAIPSLLTVRI